MSSMKYCMFENLNKDIAEILLMYEEGEWEYVANASELSNVKEILADVEYLRYVLEEIVDIAESTNRKED